MLIDQPTYSPRLTEARMAEMMHTAGLKPSLHRLAVMDAVCNGRRHPSADELYATLRLRFPSVSRTTIYNALHALVDCGLIRELEIEAGNLRYDMAPPLPHSHFLCRRCGRIFDMAMPAGLAAAASEGFSIDCIDLTFKGLCPDCQNNQNK